MAKTLKQILDGIKSSKTKTKDILGAKPGVDYAPKARDERKFADKHEVEQHADRVGNGSDVYSATNVKYYMDTEKAGHHGHKSGEDEKVYEAMALGASSGDSGGTLGSNARAASNISGTTPSSSSEPKLECNMSEAGTVCEVHGMKKCPAKVLREKPVKENLDEGFVLRDKWMSKDRSKKAEFHHNPTTDEVKVTHHENGKHLAGKDKVFPAAKDAMSHIKKYVGEETDLEEKAAVAKSKQTMLVTKKGSKTAGGVMRIKKSEYDPKKHDLAEDEEINELSKDTVGRYARKAHSKGDMAARMSNFGKNKDMATYANKRHAGVQTAVNKLAGHARINATEDTVDERKMSDAEMKKREHIVKGMKKKLSDFRQRYGERAKDVMYATATKQAMGEDLAQPLIGSTDPAKDNKKKKMEQSAPAVTPITMPDFSADVNTGRNV